MPLTEATQHSNPAGYCGLSGELNFNRPASVRVAAELQKLCDAATLWANACLSTDVVLHCRFLFFLIPIILGVVSLALIGRIVRQTRSMLTGLMTVLLILTIYSTNRVYDLAHFSSGTFHKVSAGTFGVFCGIDISLFGLIYLLGLEF